MPIAHHAVIVAAVLVGTAASSAAGQSDALFVFQLTETGNPSNALTVGGSTLPDLLVDLGDQQGDFSSFDGTAFDATVQYAGIVDAIDVSYDPMGGIGGGEVVIITALLGYDGPPLVFDAANGDIGQQLEDYFLQNDDDTIENFLAAVAAQSPVAVTDGNPLASTARSARYSFFRYGLFSDITPTDRELRRVFAERAPVPMADPNDTDAGAPGQQDGIEASPSIFMPQGASELEYGGTRFRLDFRGQTIDAGGFTGESFNLALSTEVRFHDRVSVIVGVPVSFHSVGDGEVFNAGLHAGVPVRLLIPDEDDRIGVKWQITPFANLDSVFSYDLAAGGLLYGFGLNNLVQFDLGPVSLVTSQQYSVHESLTLDVDEYSFNPGVEQQILKLGVKLQWYATDNAYLYGGGVWTDFLEDAAVDTYTTGLAGVGLRTSNGFNVVVGYEGDFGDDYEAHGAAISLQLPF